MVIPPRAVLLVIAEVCTVYMHVGVIVFAPAFELTGICTNCIICASKKGPDVELAEEN